MITLGTDKIKGLYLGETEIKAVYLGDAKIYPDSTLGVTASLAFAAAGGSGTLVITVDEWQTWTLAGLPAGWTASRTSGTGPGSVTVTAPNNTSTSPVSGTLKVSSEGLSATCSLSQAAGVKMYGDVVISTFSYADIAAAGGTVTPSLAYSQTWGWNGTTGGGTLVSGASVSYSGTGVAATTGAVGASTLGAAVKERSRIAAATVTVTLNGKSGSKTVDVYQAANERKAGGTSGGVMTYGDVKVGTISNKIIPASGGEATSTAGNGSQTWNKSAVITTYTYTSGATSQETTTGASSGTNPVSPDVTSITASAPSKSTNASSITVIKSQEVTWKANGKSANGFLYIYQEPNEKTYGDIDIASFSYPSVAGGGGTSTPAVGAVTQATAYTSGASSRETVTGERSFSIPSAVSGASVNGSTGVVTWEKNGGASARSVTVRLTVTANGRIMTKDAVCTQEGKLLYTPSHDGHWTVRDITVGATGYPYYRGLAEILVVRDSPITVDTAVDVSFDYHVMTSIASGEIVQRSMRFSQTVPAGSTVSNTGDGDGGTYYGVIALSPAAGVSIDQDSVKWTTP